MTKEEAVKGAELLLAELHQVLLFKKDNHPLTGGDEFWLAESKRHYDKHKGDINAEAIKTQLAMSRLTNKPYTSPMSGKVLDLPAITNAKAALDLAT